MSWLANAIGKSCRLRSGSAIAPMYNAAMNDMMTTTSNTGRTQNLGAPSTSEIVLTACSSCGYPSAPVCTVLLSSVRVSVL
ncbi:Uncharacterised protein [Mycobacteroides abscessus subsp. abscessus]|nr:Uncharacterised protein [Mycobacteroides abscessus subsp. abscessus]